MDKKRCTNFRYDEVELLVDLVEKHKEVVECKKTDAVSSNTKETEWQAIETKFNAECGTGRTSKMLRSKWDSLKKTTKKEYAEYKQRLYKTGGGPPADLKLHKISDKVLSIIGVAATGTTSRFDSDFVEENETNPKLQKSNINEVPFILEHAEVRTCSWEAWNPQQLREPKSTALQLPNDVIINEDVIMLDTCTGSMPGEVSGEADVINKPKLKRNKHF